MANTRPSVQKRLNEVAKLDKREAKAARRAEQKAAKAAAPATPEGEDPDLAGIVAGPQPERTDP